MYEGRITPKLAGKKNASTDKANFRRRFMYRGRDRLYQQCERCGKLVESYC